MKMKCSYLPRSNQRNKPKNKIMKKTDNGKNSKAACELN